MTADTTALPTRRRWLPAIARWLMGLPLLVGGVNGLFHIFKDPEPQLPAGAMAFATALAQTGYMMQLIAATHLAVALMLLSNRFVPLALAIFAPFLVNALAFHLVLEHGGLPIVAVFVLVELYLAWCYRAAFRPMLAARVAI